MEPKSFKTHVEQVELLKSRGLTINDYDKAIEILTFHSYYELINGYKPLFLNKSISIKNREDKYYDWASFEQIYTLYQFDKELRHIYFNALTMIEVRLRSLISYTFSEKYGYNHNTYLQESNFVVRGNSKEFESFHEMLEILTKNIHSAIRTKKNPIYHYHKQHGYIPLWVLMLTMSFGNLSYFYSFMEQKLQQKVAKKCNLSDKNLKIIIRLLTMFRNATAHNERFYCYRLQKLSLPKVASHQELKIENGNNGPLYGRQDLMAAFIAFREIFGKNAQETVLFERQLTNLLNEYKGKLPQSVYDNVLNDSGLFNLA